MEPCGCKTPKTAEGPCPACRELVLDYCRSLLALGVRAEQMAAGSCRACMGDALDGLMAEAMREYALREPAARGAVRRVIEGFLTTAPLPSAEAIRAELRRLTR